MGGFGSRKSVQENPYGTRLREGWQGVAVVGVRKFEERGEDKVATGRGSVVIELENEYGEVSDLWLSDSRRDRALWAQLYDAIEDGEFDIPDDSTLEEVYKICREKLFEAQQAFDVEAKFGKGDRSYILHIKPLGQGGTDEELGEYELPDEPRTTVEEEEEEPGQAPVKPTATKAPVKEEKKTQTSSVKKRLSK